MTVTTAPRWGRSHRPGPSDIPPHAIAALGIEKSFGPRAVLRGVDLDVPRGSILGLLGPNGAGKTTLIRILTGLTRPGAGHALVDGIDVVRDGRSLGAHIGLAPQDLGIYPQLTTRQNLIVFGQLSGMHRREALARADEVLGLLTLESCSGQSAGHLSGGQKRRLHTGIALMHRPAVLFLDEPTVGADVAARAAILDVVRRMADDGAAVVYTTHYLPELEALGAHIAVLKSGRIAVEGALDQVIRDWARPTVRVSFRNTPPRVTGWHPVRGALEPLDRPADPGAAVAHLLSCPQVDTAELVDVQVIRADLERAYLAITGESDVAADGGAQNERRPTDVPCA